MTSPKGLESEDRIKYEYPTSISAVAFPKWRSLMGEKGFKSNAKVASFSAGKVIQLSVTNANDKCCLVAVHYIVTTPFCVWMFSDY